MLWKYPEDVTYEKGARACAFRAKNTKISDAVKSVFNSQIEQTVL